MLTFFPMQFGLYIFPFTTYVPGFWHLHGLPLVVGEGFHSRLVISNVIFSSLFVHLAGGTGFGPGPGLEGLPPPPPIKKGIEGDVVGVACAGAFSTGPGGSIFGVMLGSSIGGIGGIITGGIGGITWVGERVMPK